MIERFELIPFFHSYDATSGRLTLRWASHIPEEIFYFSDSIRILDITGGTVSELPKSFSSLVHLFAVFLGENNFTVFPEILSQCLSLRIISFKNWLLEYIPEDSFPAGLEWLVLTNNPGIQEIPKSIGRLRWLKKLALAWTGLSQLPESLQDCKELEFLRISACCFSDFPRWLYDFPRMAWLATAWNPCSQVLDHIKKIPSIWMEDIEMLEVINESNISIVSRWRMCSTAKEMVIKKFKSQITSDGHARDDINASIAIGQHPNLISVLAIVESWGISWDISLVSELIPEKYHKLGYPPSLESCTRDTYLNKPNFSLQYVCNILIDISSACEYIHARWISHGDLYAHNILVDTYGHAILTDFWAATFYDRELHPEYEFFDVRAFGYLMEELLSFGDWEYESNSSIRRLQKIKDDCLAQSIFTRPNFKEIYWLILKIY
jgi:serine/threonine protein kinase